MGFTEQELLIERLNGKFTRIYQKKAAPEDDVPF